MAKHRTACFTSWSWTATLQKKYQLEQDSDIHLPIEIDKDSGMKSWLSEISLAISRISYSPEITNQPVIRILRARQYLRGSKSRSEQSRVDFNFVNGNRRNMCVNVWVSGCKGL